MVFISVISTNLNDIDFSYITNNNRKYRQLFLQLQNYSSLEYKFLFLAYTLSIWRVKIRYFFGITVQPRVPNKNEYSKHYADLNHIVIFEQSFYHQIDIFNSEQNRKYIQFLHIWCNKAF